MNPLLFAKLGALCVFWRFDGGGALSPPARSVVVNLDVSVGDSSSGVSCELMWQGELGNSGWVDKMTQDFGPSTSHLSDHGNAKKNIKHKSAQQVSICTAYVKKKSKFTTCAKWTLFSFKVPLKSWWPCRKKLLQVRERVKAATMRWEQWELCRLTCWKILADP